MNERDEAQELYQERVSVIMEGDGMGEEKALALALGMASGWLCRRCGIAITYRESLQHGRYCEECASKNLMRR